MMNVVFTTAAQLVGSNVFMTFFFVLFVSFVLFVAGLGFGEAPIMSPRGSTS
jgi:uncharacterized protein (DUF486 family)